MATFFVNDINENHIILDENEICNSILELKDHEDIIAEPAGAMSSASLWYYKEKIIGKNSREISKILGFEGQDEVVHKDNLVKFST